MSLFGKKVAAIAVLGLFVLAARPAAASEGNTIDAARARVARAVSDWEGARTRRREVQRKYETLAHRISALKRLRTEKTFSGEAELERLLRESVSAEAALRDGARAVDQASLRVKQSVSETVALIDARIKALAPGLKTGALSERQTAARTVKDLIAVRGQLKGILLRLREPSAAPREWSRYEVKIDPLDGPAELREKADFVEDTRDKLRRKREEIARLLKDAREERKLLQASAEFQTDARLFDEEARSFRVTRRDERSNRLATTTQGKTQSEPTPPASSETTSNGGRSGDDSRSAGATPPAAPENADAFASPAPPATAAESPSDPQTGASGGGVPGGGVSGGGVPGGGVSGGGVPGTGATGGGVPGVAGGAAITKAVDPSALLNLRVESLEAGSVDLGTLESLVTDLQELDGFLEDRATEIRKRAAELGEDEARALGHK